MGIFDVNASDLIESIAEDLGRNKSIKKPAFTEYVKTGANRERAPLKKEWFFLRMSSILYRVYKDGPVGTESLRTYYGGKKNRGVKPEHFMKASGKILRLCLQELEKQGYVKKSKKGRVITGNGEKFLIEKSKHVNAFLENKNELSKKLREDKVERMKFTEIRRKQREDLRRIAGKPIAPSTEKSSASSKTSDGKASEKTQGKK